MGDVRQSLIVAASGNAISGGEKSLFQREIPTAPAGELEACTKLFSAAAKVAKGSQESCLSVCGQCAPVLWEQGNTEAAIQLERELTDIVKRLHVDVFCGYPRDTFHGEQHQPDFQSICSEHSAVHLI